MVMSFSVPIVLEHLIDNGVVYTYRKNERKRTGKNWINANRGQPKIADVTISLARKISVEDMGEQLKPYVEHSGFSTVESWHRVICNLNDWNLGSEGWLYKVELLEPFKEFTTIEIRVNRNPWWLKPREQQGFFLSEYFPIGEYELPERFKYHGERNIEDLWELFDKTMLELGFVKVEENGEK